MESSINGYAKWEGRNSSSMHTCNVYIIDGELHIFSRETPESPKIRWTYKLGKLEVQDQRAASVTLGQLGYISP